jgi:hypothetical protein
MAAVSAPWRFPPTRLATLVQADPSQHLPLPLPLPPRPDGAAASAAPDSSAALLPPLAPDEEQAMRALSEDSRVVDLMLDALRQVDMSYM